MTVLLERSIKGALVSRCACEREESGGVACLDSSGPDNRGSEPLHRGLLQSSAFAWVAEYPLPSGGVPLNDVVAERNWAKRPEVGVIQNQAFALDHYKHDLLRLA